MSCVCPVRVRDVEIGAGRLAILAGPCVLESFDLSLDIALRCRDITSRMGLGYVFKASFDKANRTSISSFRGPGIERGLEWLGEIASRADVPVVTDIHETQQAALAAEVVDLLQIPAFLCRQTDLLVAAAKTGRPVNVKKAQFLAPGDMAQVTNKLRDAGCSGVLLCERGTTFGYGQLVVDMRALALMRSLGCPVVFDATHSVQMPGGLGSTSSGDRRFILPLARAAAAVGIDALFLETHPDPASAKSDGPNMVPLEFLPRVLGEVREISERAREIGFADLDWAKEERS